MRFTQNDNQGPFACDKTQCALYKDDNQQGDCSRPLLSCLRWLCLSVMANPSGESATEGNGSTLMFPVAHAAAISLLVSEIVFL